MLLILRSLPFGKIVTFDILWHNIELNRKNTTKIVTVPNVIAVAINAEL